MSKLLVATGNPGKLVEIKALLEGVDVELLIPSQLGLNLTVEEDGQTYKENAERKGKAYAQASGLLTLSDDSGLEADALNGLPGIHSARFAPLPGATDADRRAYLLERLRDHSRPWKARFRCVVALARPDGEVFFTEGICTGEIIPEERGHNGFGYDPIFYIPELGCTMAELKMEVKNRISHRGKAVKAARPILTRLLKMSA